jgi:hypothetical protein
MKYAVEIDSGAMTYMPSLFQNCFIHSKVDKRDIQTQTAWRWHKRPLILSK